MAKKIKKTSYLQKRQTEEVNKKALIWIGSIVIAVIVIITVLLALDI